MRISLFLCIFRAGTIDMGRYILLLLAAIVPLASYAQRYDVSGTVAVKGTGKPIGQAVVELPRNGLWTVADNEGRFTVRGVPHGKTEFVVSCLGYVTTVSEVEVTGRIDSLRLYAPEDNLTLESVVVTAKEAPNAMSTSRTIGSNALDHLQVVDASDIASLLPGGKTANPDLTSASEPKFALRSGGSMAGNAQFGTAVEVDGVRLSTNASMGDLSGASTRNIASSNIEEVEVITGVPSAEYGDISSGIVRISTRKGRTPYTVTMATNPRTKQFSVSKGFDLGGERGVLNANLEYTRATKNPVSPYTSYTRRGLSLNYQRTFRKVLRFNFGVAGNIGGMNTEDDPDAFVGEYEKKHDNALRANVSLKWLLDRRWITNIDFSASLNYEDNLSKVHKYNSSTASAPAVHSMEEGYFVAQMLPTTYFSTQYVDSKELDYAANLKATWVRSWGGIRSSAKIGASWTANGNVGEGEYYADPALAKDGYRPRPYTDIPYMHNLAGYVEETLTLPLGSTSLQLMVGLRAEKTYIEGSKYDKTANLSPRLNLKYRVSDRFSVRAGWGITEKLPSFNILYPSPQYRDTRIFSASYGSENFYVYHTQPFETLYNPALRWQRNRNAEVGMEFTVAGAAVSLVGYFNKTSYPFALEAQYDPFTYRMGSLPSELPDGTPYVFPANPRFKLDRQTGEIFVRDADRPDGGWVLMNAAERRTFVRNTYQANTSPVNRMGLEFVVDFPEIRPIRTQLRLDGTYGYTRYVEEGESWYYPSVTLRGEPYPYVGIYPDNGGSATVTYNGCETHALDANLTAITRIPSIRMVVTLRLEASLLYRSQNLSLYDGKTYAYTVSDDGTKTPTGGDIYAGNSYTALRPLAYIDLDGNRHPFTQAEAENPDFANLILQSGNACQFAADGYDPYFSANLSVTKEIGDHVSVSFYANNFTNARAAVKYYATGVSQILTPKFFYGLTVRLKF